jgi:hypothetical protein
MSGPRQAGLEQVIVILVSAGTQNCASAIELSAGQDISFAEVIGARD